MNSEEYAKNLARELMWATEEQDQSKKHREEIRDEFLRVVNEEFKGKDHMLPVKTIEVPDTFFETTNMTEEDFAASRFPGWNVEHVEKNIAKGYTVFVLKRDSSYLPKVIETDDGENSVIRASKEVAEYVPEIDWETLTAERPDLVEKIGKKKLIYELDEQGLESLSVEDPEELATLERHMKVRSPSIKTRARRLKRERASE